MWEKALRRDTVLPWIKSLAICFNTIFIQSHLYERKITPKLVQTTKVQKTEKILEEEIQERGIR